MAAYAALVSLMHIIDDIETHPSPPISLDKQQVQSLTEKLVLLQEFLESYNSPFAYSDEADPLEMRIVDVAHAAEDVIESYIIDTVQLSAKATNDNGDEQVSCIHLYQDVQNVIEEMDLLKKEETKEKKVVQKDNMGSDGAGFRSNSTEKNHLMIGFDGVLLQLLDRLTDGNTNRQIIPIVGMGGIGKTTLAKGAFEHQLIKDHFDICVWITISQEYNIVEILREVLIRVGGSSSNMNENDLQVALHKCLWGKRYLIILDDMWSIDVWDKLKFFFPDCNESSRIVVTTRMSNLAAHLTDSYNVCKMNLLDEDSSWTLFSKTVFGEQSFPTDLKQIGKEIVEKCNGLPLAIAVVGGLMAKSNFTLGYWEHMHENLSAIVNSENDDYCLKILKLSYNHLPAYLKPCFLYMGVFEEDRVISASEAVRLWISEGFLKPINNKSLNTVAKEYLKELVDRNLILVHGLGLLGNVKSCKIHDLLRDLCLKEAKKQRFFCIVEEQSPRGITNQHRIVIPTSTPKEKIRETLDSMSHARTYVHHKFVYQELPNSRFMRTLDAYISPYTGYYLYPLDNVFHLVNSRYLAFGAYWESVIPSMNLLWNLHTLIIACSKDIIAPIGIWKMHKLRYVHFTEWRLHLPDPPSIDNDIIIMENLEVVKGVKNLSLSEDDVKRIPNIMKLDVIYNVELIERVDCLSYLQCFSKLESLMVRFVGFDDRKCVQKMSFPPSLKKLYLKVPTNFELEDIVPMLGALPLLWRLTLQGGRFRTRNWETVEGQFCSLRSLALGGCDDLEHWTVLREFPLSTS
ncbi:putative late blight resistance protein homolog R1B-16 [Salvia splendens]|uniref:putative late blight resistance protein homolog R1B-16 n=1 Tax=Salvia splendens TaxID=180675 RepID=UPI001C275752|nr:putative late blight resistance protein homolog R1B-16 [Salvia splendens]